MRRNCNLELNLFPLAAASGDCHHRLPREETTPTTLQDHPHQPLTIFYNGQIICVSDVTEMQARAILMFAGKESEERQKTPTDLEPPSPSISPLYSPGTSGLSMKRSLQRFLQKRKNRIQDASPYHH